MWAENWSDWYLQDWKMTENQKKRGGGGVEIAGLENDGL